MSPHPFSVREDGSRVTVRFTTKELSDEVIGDIGDDLTRLAERFESGHLHFDLAEVDYVSSAALGKIVALHKRLARAGGRLSLGNVNDFPFEVFYVTRLHTILDIRRKRAAKQSLST